LDAKFYLKMFTKIAVHVAEPSKAKGLDAARTAACVELPREYVNFLQCRVPDFIEQFFDLVGAITALAFYDRRISLTCLCLVTPLLLIRPVFRHNAGEMWADTPF
jgi:hypothetical protein